MAEWGRLRNAPIIEALIDIRCKLPSDITIDQLAKFHDTIRDRYPERRTRTSWEGSIRLTAEGHVAVSSTQGRPDGYVFRSMDGRQSIQVRLDGFTFNRFKPYDHWEQLRDEAKQHWQGYASTTRVEAISRLGLRYINRLEIPLPFSDFREYVLTSPEIAPGLPQSLSNFLMRLQVPHPKSGSVAIITETIERPKDSQSLPLILDIDVIREASFDPRTDEHWEVFEQLHDFANEIFFTTLTDKAKELFQ